MLYNYYQVLYFIGYKERNPTSICRIIPFVAADAVVEEKPSPTVYPSPEKIRPTDSPVFFDVSHNNMFSPPVETEGV